MTWPSVVRTSRMSVGWPDCAGCLVGRDGRDLARFDVSLELDDVQPLPKVKVGGLAAGDTAVGPAPPGR